MIKKMETGVRPLSYGYLSLNKYAQKKFGKKLYKISLPGSTTCPNRDGTCGSNGCIFCSAGGSGEFAAAAGIPVEAQIAQAKEKIKDKLPKNKDVGYIAYFQSFTGTYPGREGSLEKLKERWIKAACDEEVEVVSIATRPDCLGEDVLDCLREVKKIKPLWIELGLQTIHEETAAYIRRGYDQRCFDEALEKLEKIGAEVIVHVILGLPNESREAMLDTVRYVAGKRVQGIKLQLLHVLKGTDLEKEYAAGRFEVMTKEEYFEVLKAALEIIPSDMVVHRLTGDGPKKLLVAPVWTMDKKRVMNDLNKLLR